jgi:hypothetical protein
MPPPQRRERLRKSEDSHEADELGEHQPWSMIGVGAGAEDRKVIDRSLYVD